MLITKLKRARKTFFPAAQNFREILISAVHFANYPVWQSLFFMLKNLNKEALDTERNLGNACSSRKVYYMRKNIEQSHEKHINDEIQNAIYKKSIL